MLHTIIGILPHPHGLTSGNDPMHTIDLRCCFLKQSCGQLETVSNQLYMFPNGQCVRTYWQPPQTIEQSGMFSQQNAHRAGTTCTVITQEQHLELTVHGMPCTPSTCTHRRMILSADPHLPDMHGSTSAVQNADTHMHSHVWKHTVCIYPFDKQCSHQQPKRTSVHIAIQSIADTAAPPRAPSQ